MAQSPGHQKTLSREHLIHIVQRSAFLNERLDGEFFPLPGPAEPDAGRKLEQWKQAVAAGDTERFSRQLGWEGVEPERAANILGEVQLPSGKDLPGWTETLRDYVRAAASIERRGRPPWINPEDPLAFEELFAPLLHVAAERVRGGAASPGLLSETALNKLVRALLERFSTMAGECLDLEFTAFRFRKQLSTGAFGSWPGFISRQKYDEFVNHLFEGQLVTFLCEYPVLARYLATTADLWVEATNEFLLRLAEDCEALGVHFLNGAFPGEAIDVQPGLSDLHNGGRSAILVRFATGLELFYKPKPLRAERQYYELLQFLNANGNGLDLRIFRVLDRGAYGWSERIEHVPCKTLEEVTRYYERSGMLLALMFALEAVDCHYENLIACGEYPALIDMETLLQHRVVEEGAEGPWSAANRMFFLDSVFRTGLLPRWQFGAAGECYDLSGLGCIEQQATSELVNAWEHVNTDGMRLLRERKKTTALHNVVWLNERRIAPSEHVESIVKGFCAMYDRLHESADRLLAPDGPLEAMRAMPVRFVYRLTRVYRVVLNGVFSPSCLRDGAEAGIRLGVLGRPLLYADTRHPFWNLCREEIRALQRGDVPAFHAYPDSADLSAGPAGIANAFTKPSYDLMRERFAGLTDEDRDRQIAYIRSAFLWRSVGGAVPRSASSAEPVGELAESDAKRLFVEEALRIAQLIRDSAITGAGGAATWVTVACFPESQRYQLQPMSPYLFDGTAGVAVFLAALARVTGIDAFRDFAFRALRGIQAALSDPGYDRMLFESGIGAGVGGASTLYALVCCSRLLDSPSLLADAERVVKMMTAERINSDSKLDLLLGAAGALVALLSYSDATADAAATVAARLCGERLLAARTESPSGHRAWPTLESRLLGGFSHGAAGIAYALVRLYEATGDGRYVDAAREGCAYENSLFDRDSGNWFDLRASRKENLRQCSWCHGAAGIALGRALSARVQRSEWDLDNALQRTVKEPLLDLDQMCCGNLGRADILLEAGRLLNRPEYGRSALQLAIAVAQRGRRTGEYGLGWENGRHIPSFHQGMSGIGYGLLRQAFPDQLPCVLAWR